MDKLDKRLNTSVPAGVPVPSGSGPAADTATSV